MFNERYCSQLTATHGRSPPPPAPPKKLWIVTIIHTYPAHIIVNTDAASVPSTRVCNQHSDLVHCTVVYQKHQKGSRQQDISLPLILLFLLR